MVDCASLENWRARKGSVGSNPTPSANSPARYFRVGELAFWGLGREPLQSKGLTARVSLVANVHLIRASASRRDGAKRSQSHPLRKFLYV